MAERREREGRQTFKRKPARAEAGARETGWRLSPLVRACHPGAVSLPVSPAPLAWAPLAWTLPVI